MIDTRHDPAQYQNQVRLCKLLTTIDVSALFIGPYVESRQPPTGEIGNSGGLLLILDGVSIHCGVCCFVSLPSVVGLTQTTQTTHDYSMDYSDDSDRRMTTHDNTDNTDIS